MLAPQLTVALEILAVQLLCQLLLSPFVGRSYAKVSLNPTSPAVNIGVLTSPGCSATRRRPAGLEVFEVTVRVFSAALWKRWRAEKVAQQGS